MSDKTENNQPQVLVADDDPSILRYVKAILEKVDFNVISARDGAEAYKILASREPFAAAIFDMVMPQIQGLDLLKHMKSDRRLMNIPVIIMTAEQNARLLPESFKSGAAAFLPKPFTIAQLQSMLKLFVHKNLQYTQ